MSETVLAAPRRYGLLIGGEWVEGREHEAIRYPWDGSIVGWVPVGTVEDVERALAAAEAGARAMRRMPAYARAELLERVADALEARRVEFARLLTREMGKPIKDNYLEMDRAIAALRLCAEEAKRIAGETVPLDAVASGAGKFGFYIREPIGIVAGITGFNFPLLLDCHKVGPAIAAGNSIVLKPAPATPIVALELGGLFADAGAPAGAVNVVTGGAEVGERLVTDPRVAMVAFTGSSAVGRRIRETAGFKRVALELGNSSAVIICEDANLDKAVAKCTRGGFYAVGQACIAVQRLLVHRSRFEEFAARYAASVGRLVMGDPMDEATDISTLVSDAATERVTAWIEEAVAAGARVITGGKRRGRLIEPTVLSGVPASTRLGCEEVFGPVVTVDPYDDFDEALDRANATPYGLQAGVFTYDIRRIMRAVERLQVGGVMVNEASSYRADHMPYGGVKASGMGREGPRYAIEEMTEIKMVAIDLNE